MTQIPTRPEQVGNDHAIASTHWMATAVGADVLARGGNAADAAVATGFALQVVEPHLNGPAGEVPIIVHTDAGVQVLDGQGVAPAGATIAHYRSEGLDLVPGTGLLAATVPSSFVTWTTLLERFGTWELADVLEPAIAIAERGYPMLASAARSIAAVRAHFVEHWPTSAAAWLTSDGRAPAAGERWTSPVLAATWRRLVAEASVATTREARIIRGREVFTAGFVAEEIERFARGSEVMDSSGRRHRGVIEASDLAAWSPTVQAPEQTTYGGWTVSKTTFWGQGPVMLQHLRLLDRLGLGETDYGSVDYYHLLLEASKLAFADREAWYGDPDVVDVPGRTLLSSSYAAGRAELVGARASMELRPGSPDGREPRMPRPLATPTAPSAGVGEPTVARQTDPTLDAAGSTRGDTCHLDVTDRWGMTISATPSGGWLQSSPTIPALGFCLGSRAQMFWLEEGLPASLAPGKRPRTTLSPSLAVHEDGTVMSFGTPGGDQQDQWSTTFFLALVHGGLGLQAALEEPMLHHLHAPESFAPRAAFPGVVVAEPRLGAAVLDGLTARGHRIEPAPDWSLGRTSAVTSAAPDGFVRGAANPRGVQGGAIAR